MGRVGVWWVVSARPGETCMLCLEWCGGVYTGVLLWVRCGGVELGVLAVLLGGVE